jgi:RNA polymerase sigma-70 factor (ECF subfamily)
VEAGVVAWPALRVDRDAFARHVAALPNPSLSHAGDLLLAFACASRNNEAIRLLDPLLRSAVATAVAKVDSSPSFADDVGQVLREKLLLSDPPAIGTYAGRASLRTWLQMAALRAAMNMRRRREDDAGARVALTSSCSTTAADADLAYLRARYREHFAAALRDAVARLPEKDRRMLHLHLVERTSHEKLAATHGVSASTIARWLAATRDRLAIDTKETLRARLPMTSPEYDALALLVRSDLDVSLPGLLGGAGAARAGSNEGAPE